MRPFPSNRLDRSQTIPVAFTLVITAVAGCALLLWPDPLAPLLLICIAVTAAAALLLLQYPLFTTLLATALYAWPSGTRPASLEFLFTFAVNGTLALALAGYLLQVVRGQKDLSFTPAYLGFGLFLTWAMASVLWAPDLVEARRSLVAYASGLILLLLLTNYLRQPHALAAFMRVLRLLGWGMIAAGAAAVLLGNHSSGGRLKVLEMNENEFGIVVIMTVPGVLWPVLRQPSLRRRLNLGLSFIFLASAMVLVALTGSRGSSLSLLLLMLSFLFSKPLRLWGVCSLAACLVLLASAPFVFDTVLSRFAEQGSDELGGRDLIWRASLRLIGDAPLTGTGIGNGPAKLHNYIAAVTSYFNKRIDLPAHNPLLEVGIETGIVGLCLYAEATAIVFVQFLGKRTRANLRAHGLASYFPLVLGTAAGYFLSWIKGGGAESHPSFFIMLALLQIPPQLVPVSDSAAMSQRRVHV